MALKRAALLTGVVLLGALTPGVGRATYPGGNGMIAFTNLHSEDIFVMNADGSLPGAFLSDPKLDEDDPSWSADGNRLVFVTSRYSDTNPDYDIEVVDADGGGRLALTNSSVDERHPVFSPDGTQIAFVKRVDDLTDLYVMNSDGSGEAKLTDEGDVEGPIDWNPDGTSIAFSLENNFGQHIAEYGFPTDSVTALTPVSEAKDVSPSYSPDGTQVAYARFPSIEGDPTARVINVDGTNDHAVTSVERSVAEVTWAPDGSGLLVQENGDRPTTAMVDSGGPGRSVLGHEYAGGLAWQPCSELPCTVPLPRRSITEVTLAVRDGRQLNVFVEVSPIRAADVVLVTLFRKKGTPKFKEIGTLQALLGEDGLAKATFTIGRKGRCKAVGRYVGNLDYQISKDKGKFSCKGGIAAR